MQIHCSGICGINKAELSRKERDMNEDVKEKEKKEESGELDMEELADFAGGRGSAFDGVPRASEDSYDQDTRGRA